MKKQLQTNSRKTENRTTTVLCTLTLMLASMKGFGQTAYLPNYGDGTVSVIDVAANKVVNTIQLGPDSYPFGVSVSPDGTKAYIGNVNTELGNAISIINTATNSVSSTIPLEYDPSALAVSPDGNEVYFANRDDNLIGIVLMPGGYMYGTIPVGKPWGIAVSPDGNSIYVANGYDSLSVIDALFGDVTATIIVGDIPEGIAVSPDGSKVYVANFISGTVSVINTAADTVTATIPVGSGPNGIIITPDGNKVYVTNGGDSSVSVINTAMNSVSATIQVGSAPFGISVSPDGSKVLVANAEDNTVSVIDTATNTASATIIVGAEPFAFGNFISAYALPTSIVPLRNESADINLYPNPTNNLVTIHTSFVGAAIVSIVNILGQTEGSYTISFKEGQSEALDISQLSTGAYFLQLKSGNQSDTKMFMKE